MIYWKRTDVFGFPEHNATVLLWWLNGVCEGRLVLWADVPMWEVDSKKGDTENRVPLPEITHWSEANGPVPHLTHASR